MMEWWQNIPFFSIMLPMLSAIISSALKEKATKRLCLGVTGCVCAASGVLLYLVNASGEPFTYKMGHFPAPWGNEIRCGTLEALLALAFSAVMLLSLVGGMKHIVLDIEQSRRNLYFVIVDLLFGALIAMVYTNDIFTGYVFVEIMTITSCGILMVRHIGRTTLAAVRYMVTSLLGSGLFLIGIVLLFDLTGHLLMPNMRASVESLVENGQYTMPLLVVASLICIGLAIKSGLFPFHFWMPDTYGYATPASSAILSGLVSKSYIFLCVKIIIRVLGFDYISSTYVFDILFVFGLAAIIVGSISAIRERDIRRMIAFSSAAQIGYIYVAISLGTTEGMCAAIFHMLSHAATKPLLFISASGLSDVSGESKDFSELKGSAHRNGPAGLGFAIGALSMVGLPMFSGFITKLLICTTALEVKGKALPTLIVLAVSVILNAIYFLRTVIRIYTRTDIHKDEKLPARGQIGYTCVMGCFIALNLLLGLCSSQIMELIGRGLSMLA